MQFDPQQFALAIAPSVLRTAAVLIGILVNNGRFGDLNGRFGDINGKFSDLNARIGDLNGRLNDLNGKVDAFRAEVHRDMQPLEKLFDSKLARVE